VKGVVSGLARRAESRLPMEELSIAVISPEVGVLGDCKGRKFPDRHVTILTEEGWQAALLDLAGPAGPPDLPWTARRANVLVRGVRLPRGTGSVISLGDCLLQVMCETTPCQRMNEAFPGLMTALAPDWRGGVICKVLTGGAVFLHDPVADRQRDSPAKEGVLAGISLAGIRWRSCPSTQSRNAPLPLTSAPARGVSPLSP
jgi:MOSC domain-containing protein YiiM